MEGDPSIGNLLKFDTLLCERNYKPQAGEEIFANHISDKELTSNIYRKILKNSTIRKQPNKEMGKRYK